MEDKNITWPSTFSNAWMVEQREGILRYMSDQYEGRIIGFEEREAITHAQTPPMVIGIVAFGGGVVVERHLPERFNWHVVDEEFRGNAPCQTAESLAIISQIYARNFNKSYKSFIAISHPQPGITELDALSSSENYVRILERVKMAKSTSEKWDKAFFVDRISLALLSGAPQTPEIAADFHYAAIAHEMRGDITLATGQTAFPLVLVSQGAGTQTNGTSEVILAEGRLDLVHPTIGFIVATPKYPFQMMENMPGTHTPESAALIDEIECIALAEVHAGQPWYCPSMQSAMRDQKRIVVEFSTLSDLVFGEGFHGFHLYGCENGAKIVSVEASKKTIIIMLDKEPIGSIQIRYAWGVVSSHEDGWAANNGSLRDSWSVKSAIVDGAYLSRFALSGRVKVRMSTS